MRKCETTDKNETANIEELVDRADKETVNDIRELIGILDEYLDGEDDSDYELDELAFARLERSYITMSRIVKQCDGTLSKLELKPKELHVGVEATFDLLYLSGDNVSLIGECLKYASAVSIDANLDGVVSVSYTIPNVFRKK